MKSPLLSLVIPTKNRYQCLIEVLNTLAHFKSDEIEFIIQDNSDDNKLFVDFMSSQKDERVKYFYTRESLPVVDNSDKAILNSSGKYVCFIGDDDIIIENIVDIVRMMEDKGIESLIQDPVTYYWQDVTFKYSNKVQRPGSFLIGQNLKLSFSKINVKDELNRIITSGGTSVGKLPRIYHGLVKRSLLDLVYQHCGTYFPGPSPDMASSTALAHFTDNCFFINVPFSISGKSAISTSGMGVAHTHKGNLGDIDFLPRNILETWDKKIPKYWSCSTIWAQSLSEALIACNNKKQLNYDKLYANLLIFEPSYREETQSVINHEAKNHSALYKVNLYTNVATMFTSRVINFLKRKMGFYAGMTTYAGIDTIEACYDKVNSLVGKVTAK